MIIKDVRVKNFRNYTDFNADLRDSVNFIIGNNATGKTNILEALFILENGKSFRTTSSSEMIKWDEEFLSVRANVNRMNRDILIETTIKINGVKQVKINGVKQTQAQARYKPVVTVLFTPDHLKVVRETPDHRRAYLDDVLEKIKPDFQYWRQQYSKILKQRNVLLKKVGAGSMNKDVIDYWDLQLIQAGAKIILARDELIRRLQSYVGSSYCEIADTDEVFELKYENQIILDFKEKNEEYKNNPEQRFKELLEKNRKKEIDRGVTIIGPHRDDLTISVNGVDIKIYGSQGEQRSASLALKLGELALVNDTIRDKPVLLLDDVMSELDSNRRHALFDFIKDDQQVVITTANENYIDDLENLPVNVIRISNGTN
jgi:DNA replication and repair protein RecF